MNVLGQSLAAQWSILEQSGLLLPDLAKSQRRQLRLAFYSGAKSVIDMVYLEDPRPPPASAMVIQLRDEIAAYGDAVSAGRERIA
jgi:hypothetical protein